MKPTSISRELEILIKIQRPGFMWGPPGIGKSNVMAQVADKLKLELQDVRAVLLDPVDLRGLPAINGDKKAHSKADGGEKAVCMGGHGAYGKEVWKHEE